MASLKWNMKGKDMKGKRLHKSNLLKQFCPNKPSNQTYQTKPNKLNQPY